MKLCFLAGANSIHTRRWIKYFVDAGHEVHLISLGRDLEEPLDNIKFHLVPKKFFRTLRPLHYLFEVKKILRRIKPDILHAHQLWIDGIVADRAGFHPLIVTPWGSDLLIGARSNAKRRLFGHIFKNADLITCDGENTRTAIIEMGISPVNVRLVGFGVDTDRFCPAPADYDLAKTVGLRGGPVIISLRNLNPIYDIETLIRAASLVVKAVPAAEFIIAGDGFEKQRLMALAAELGVREVVHFIGSVFGGDIPRYLNLAAVYVSTSLSDSGLAASTAEAMASGLPVIVSDSGDNKKWIVQGQSGFVVPIRDHAALARMVIAVISDPILAKKMGQTGRKIIEERNSYRREMEKMENLYRSLIK